MDYYVGRILDTVDSLDIHNNTIFVFTSDNGPDPTAPSQGSSGPWRGYYFTHMEGSLRTPFIIRWPGKIPAGTSRHEFVTALELFPTLLAAAGAKAPPGVVLDGFDMLPVLAGRQPTPRQDMFWESHGDKAARVGSWKWVESAAGSGVFDLAQDEGEQHDLSSARPEQARDLKDRFAAWRKAMDDAEPRGPFRDY